MVYDEIVATSLSYADREDQEVVDRIPQFILIVEARINRKLRVWSMSARATLPVVADQEYYGLPTDFGGLRDIQAAASETAGRVTLKYMNPEQLNNLQRNQAGGGGTTKGIYYTLIAKQLQIYPPRSTGILEIIYYQSLAGLTPALPQNWLSVSAPDAYIFGILTEISAFAKDKETSVMWGERFTSVMKELATEDADNRWSGTPLEVRVG